MRRLLLFLSWVTCLTCVSIGCATGQSDDSTVPPGSDAGVVDLGEPTVGDTNGTDTTLADTSASLDAGSGDATTADTGAAVDAGAIDSSTPDTGKADTGKADTGTPDTGMVDSGFSPTAHVHIYISNTCEVSTSPTSFDVPAGMTVKVSWHNHSVDYTADVWASYGGGYLDLAKSATWDEKYEHCFIKSTHTEYVDVTPAGSPSACGKQRVNFFCHAP